MHRRQLGQSPIHISPVVFGTMGHGAADPASRIATMHAAIEAGITSLDTAPLYDFGECERLVGRAIQGRRDQVEVLTKVGLRWDDTHGEVLFWFEDASGRRSAVRRDSRPAAVRRDIEESLRRLSTDYIDLCQVHHPDRHTAIGETMAVLVRMQDEGKIRAIGVSNYTGMQLREAHAALGSRPLASDQFEYNLVRRQAEREVIPVARDLNIGCLVYSPLDAGSLSGRLRETRPLHDGRQGRASFHPRNARRIHRAVDAALAPIAARHDASHAQVALAWLLAQPTITGVIAGASSPRQAQENARAAALRLDPHEVQTLGDTFARVAIDDHAGRGPAARLQSLGRRALGKAKRVVKHAIMRST